MVSDYGLLDMLYALQATTQLIESPTADTILDALDTMMASGATRDESEAVKDAWFEREAVAYTNTIIGGIEKNKVLPRMEHVGSIFLHALKLYMCLGVIPIKYATVVSRSKNISVDDYRSSEEGGEGGDDCEIMETNDVEDFIGIYMTSIEQNLARHQMLSFDDVFRNLLLTWHEGKYTATDMDGNSYRLLTFTEFFGDSMPTLPMAIVSSLIPLELQYIYAMNESKHYTIDRLTRTNVVVSSEISSEVTSILKARQTASANLEADVEGAVMRATAKIKETRDLEKKMQGIQDSLATYESTIDTDFSKQHKQKLLHFESLNKAIVELQKQMDIPMNNESSETTNPSYLGRIPVVNMMGTNEGTVPYNLIAGTGSKEAEQQKKRDFKCQQEQELAKKVGELTKMVATSKTKAELLTIENSKMAAINSHLMFEVSTLKTSGAIFEKEARDAEKRAESVMRVNKRLMDVLSEMRKMVESIGSQLRMSEKDRSRLLQLCAHEDIGGTMKSNFDYTKQAAEILMNALQKSILAPAFSDHKFEKAMSKEEAELRKHAMDMADFQPLAYEKMLDETNARPVHIFGGIEDENRLRIVNKWVPSGMGDTRVSDRLSRRHALALELLKSDTEVPICKDAPATALNKQPIIEADRLCVIDVNPRSSEDIDRTLRALKASNLITGESGTFLVDNIFAYRYLNIQFQQKGDIDGVIGTPLRQLWEQLAKHLLKLDDVTYTINGQKVNPRVGTQTIKTYVMPFFDQYLGMRDHAYKIPNLVTTFERHYEEVESKAVQCRFLTASKYELLVKGFCQHILTDK
ncbi:PREDICTED: uncharacterized protein LOC109473282 [Branchiostoma belcheri]|uniref:Uncharacterized protein LOC109473282 n=1 Tax=Branchiostoma belcheri TaxID=7741 RepID=A0A6P4ZC98_BRABE|nr:PREDICTED: uncharacterized protein LOC109473282 [Branchiostoma belcheri]